MFHIHVKCIFKINASKYFLFFSLFYFAALTSRAYNLHRGSWEKFHSLCIPIHLLNKIRSRPKFNSQNICANLKQKNQQFFFFISIQNASLSLLFNIKFPLKIIAYGTYEFTSLSAYRERERLRAGNMNLIS